MKKRSSAVLVLVLAVLLSLCACGGRIEEDPAADQLWEQCRGSATADGYENAFFDLGFRVPEEMRIFEETEAQFTAASSRNGRVFKAKNAKTEASVILSVYCMAGVEVYPLDEKECLNMTFYNYLTSGDSAEDGTEFSVTWETTELFGEERECVHVKTEVWGDEIKSARELVLIKDNAAISICIISGTDEAFQALLDCFYQLSAA